jgi:hypothetical protein
VSNRPLSHGIVADSRRSTGPECRRELRRAIERNPQLWDGSEAAHFSTDPDLVEYEIMTAAVRDACLEAARDQAARYGLDMRRREDWVEAHRLLAEDDPTWSCASFDELSSSAHSRVVKAVRKKMRPWTAGAYGRPAVAGGHWAMADPYAEEREAEIVSQARRKGFDLQTHAGRHAALAAAIQERPHLAPLGGRHWSPKRATGLQKSLGPQLTIRRGQGPQGSPVGMPKGTLADRLDGHPSGLSESAPMRSRGNVY